MTDWVQSLELELILLQLHKKTLKNSTLTLLQSFSMWGKLERWKSLISGCPMSWLKIWKKKTCNFEVSSFLVHNNNWTISGLDCDVQRKWIVYDNWKQQAQWLDWEEAPMHFPKPNLHQKKVMVTVWWSAACLIHYSFLNPGKSITSENYAQQINEMPWKLKYLQPALVNEMGPVLLYHNAQPHMAQPRLQKANELGCEVLPHPAYSPDLSPTNYHFFKHLENFFAWKMLPQAPAECRKCFPRLHRIPKHGFLCYRSKQTYFLSAKMCWL